MRHSDNQFRGLEEVTKIPDTDVPEAIRQQLQGAFNTRPGTFVTPEPTPFNTRDNSTNSSSKIHHRRSVRHGNQDHKGKAIEGGGSGIRYGPDRANHGRRAAGAG